MDVDENGVVNADLDGVRFLTPPVRPNMASGEVAERAIAPVLKTGDRKVRGFESHPLRQLQTRTR